MNNASAQQKIFPLVPEHAASDMSAVLHMIPAEKAGALPPLGVKLPEDVAASFRGTPFADLYEEALNLLRSRNITADELRYLSRALTQLLAKRTTGEAAAVSPFYIRQARLSDVDALEGLVKYWAKQGENLPRKRADIIRNIDSFAICERDGRLDIDKVFVLTRNPKFFERVGFSLTKIDALPEKILKDCENCPKRARCDELAYEYNF